MSQLPKPPLPSAPLSNEEEAAHDQDAAEGAISIAWHEAVDWAKRGDFKSLAAMLRGGTPLQDDEGVRAFLADVLDGKFSRPKGKPVQRPRMTFAIDPMGRPRWVDERDRKRFEIAIWIQKNRLFYGKRIYEAAAKRFDLDEETLRNKIRRSAKARTGRSG